MYPIWYSMTMVVLSIVVLFFMIVKLKIHPFITMTVVAVGLALAMGVPLIDPKTGIFAVMEPAMGKQLGHMVPLIALGCVIGEIIRRSGGSEVLGEKMLQRIGNKRGPLAMTMCGLLVGSTIFFDTGVILLAPVTIAVARQSRKSIIFFAIPMAIAVLGMHSIVPPHPGAVAIATALNVNFGLLIMYGLLAMLPGAGIAFLYSQWAARKLTGNGTLDLDAAYDGGSPTAGGTSDGTTPAAAGDPAFEEPGGSGGTSSTVVAAPARSTTLTSLEGHERPAVGTLLFVLLLPIVLILIQTLAGSLQIGGPAQTVLDILAFLGTPWLALTITVFCAYGLLLTPRVRRGESISFFGMQGMKPVGEILVSTGGGVAFGSIIGASGVGKQLLDTLADIHLPLVLFGFVLAAILRATLGTTTAAVTFVAVLLAQSFDTTSLNPSQLALLAVGVSAGGMCLSNFNDAGFWVLSRYFGIGEQVMLKTWTVGVTIMGCVTATIASLLWLAVS
ncbi:GntP family permease [Arthrobacter sp. 24S4-2]|uniref:GntP family permease n=1 Tax=Arthrobacter sp. 24S4-2 TaxID=2575374 RepID=UPI00158670C4|nr:SLC13 family permease [Arthrobacter sp. 24S4-2]